MSYRVNPIPKVHKPRHTIQALTSPSDVYLTLGTYKQIAVPCWYVEVKKPTPAHHHDRAYHDFKGWPSPNHRDHVCQDWDFAHTCHDPHHNNIEPHYHYETHHPHHHEEPCYHNESGHHHHRDHCNHLIDMNQVFPIRLTKEGYTAVEVVTEFIEGDERVKLVGTGKIDRDEDWVVRVNLESSSSGATTGKPYDAAWFRMSVFVSGTINGTKKKDLVMQSKVEVRPTAVK